MVRPVLLALPETLSESRGNTGSFLPAKDNFKDRLTQDWECKGTSSPPPPSLPWLCPVYAHDRSSSSTGTPFSHPATFPGLSRYSRPSAEFNRGDGAPRARGVSQQLLHRDANGHHTDWIRVGLIKNCPKSLDSFGFCERAVFGIHSLQGTAKEYR